MKNKIWRASFLVVFSVLILPNITLAAWWNPLSWFSRQRIPEVQIDKTEVLENRIKELEEKLNAEKKLSETGVKTDQALSAAKIPEAKTLKLESKSPGTISSLSPTQAQPTVQVSVSQIGLLPVDLNKSTTDLIDKFTVFKRQIEDIIVTNGYNNPSLSGQERYRAETLNNILQRVTSSLYVLKNTNPTQKNIDYYLNNLNDLKLPFDALGISPIANTRVTIGEIERQEAQAKQEKINSINSKKAEMNQLDVVIDTHLTTKTDREYVDILNSARKLNGEPVFSTVPALGYEGPIGFPYTISTIPRSVNLHAFVSDYRAYLGVELSKYQ